MGVVTALEDTFLMGVPFEGADVPAPLEGVFLLGVGIFFLDGVFLEGACLVGVALDDVLLVGVALAEVWRVSSLSGEVGLEDRSTTLSIISFSFLVGHWREDTSHDHHQTVM